MTINIDHLTESELIHLNEKIVQRLRMIRQMRAHVQMLDFKIGERVWFQTEQEEIVRGMLVRYNKKSVTVVTDDGHRWTVSPGFLRRGTAKSGAHESATVLEIEKIRAASRK
jgi:biotin-(acetyl-CoA carboxylase) ligase